MIIFFDKFCVCNGAKKYILSCNKYTDVYSDMKKFEFEIACMRGNLGIVKSLYKHGMNIHDGLCEACEYGHIDIVKFLCESESDNIVVCKDILCNSFYSACQGGSLEVAMYLYKHYSNVINIKYNNYAVLYVSFSNGNLDVVKYLCETCGVTKNDIISGKNSLLGKACCKGHIDVIRYVCDMYGFTIDDVKLGNYKVLKCASEKGHINIVEYFCEKYNIDINDNNTRRDINAILRYASYNDQIDIVKYLCEKFDLLIGDIRSDDNYILKCLCYYGYIDILRYICDKYKFVKSDIMEDGNHILYLACEKNNSDIVIYLCEKYNITIDDILNVNDGAHGLFYLACNGGCLDVVKYLCDKYKLTAGDIKSCNNYALQCISMCNYVDIAKYLCEKYPTIKPDVLSHAYKNNNINFHTVKIAYDVCRDRIKKIIKS